MVRTSNGKRGGLLKGDPHSKGGIKAIVTDDNGRPVELEGEEVIINKRSMQDRKVYRVEGTPKQIASAINSMNGNGVVIENGAKLTNMNTGQVQVMKDGGFIDFKGDDLLSFLRWWE